MSESRRAAFLEAGTWHGALDVAEAMLAEDPGLATRDIHTAAVTGDDAAVHRFLAHDPASVTARSAPYGGDALTYLCLSKFLRFDQSRSDRFLRAATALLDAGADPNSGFWTSGSYPEFESALYGAAGVAHHAGLTRLLLSRGADPNDVEVVYHSPDTNDNAAMRLVVETGRLTADSLSLMLVRKHDWHDLEGVRYLLEHGADPNHRRAHGLVPIHHAVARDNALAIVELLLDHGADPTILQEGESAVARAARRGRGDLLTLFERRGVATALPGALRLIAACARNDAATVGALAREEPELVEELRAQGGTMLAEFAGTDNTGGVRHLLDLGVPVDTVYAGDGYFGIAPASTALHVAAWKGFPRTARLLIQRGAAVDRRDGEGRTPLALAVKATVDSHWTERRTPESVEALLAAGASVASAPFPSGYAQVDELLRRHGAGT
ncbi:MAG: ankyrin repeat domain-containing protein [Gemmatimonadales bacterium]